jgi:hypothetical protein
MSSYFDTKLTQHYMSCHKRYGMPCYYTMAECDQYQAPALPPTPPSLEPRLEGTKRREQKTGKGAMQGVPVVIRVVSN